MGRVLSKLRNISNFFSVVTVSLSLIIFKISSAYGINYSAAAYASLGTTPVSKVDLKRGIKSFASNFLLVSSYYFTNFSIGTINFAAPSYSFGIGTEETKVSISKPGSILRASSLLAGKPS